jgi:hypothetical protein
MKIKSVAMAAALVAAAAASLSTLAGPEAHHPNIIAARSDIDHALTRLHAAQRANEYDMGGHAAKAEQLLGEALEEMRLAAEAANQHR